jgi:hypothetical protein
MRRIITAAVIVSSVMLTGTALTACSKSEPETLKVTESEWVVQPAAKSISSGTVRITADNVGTYEHELLVVKGTAASLPRRPDGSIIESKAKGLVGEIGGVGAGEAKLKEFDLSEGTYTLFCNIVQDIDGTETSHFVKGMHATLVVG